MEFMRSFNFSDVISRETTGGVAKLGLFSPTKTLACYKNYNFVCL